MGPCAVCPAPRMQACRHTKQLCTPKLCTTLTNCSLCLEHPLLKQGSVAVLQPLEYQGSDMHGSVWPGQVAVSCECVCESSSGMSANHLGGKRCWGINVECGRHWRRPSVAYIHTHMVRCCDCTPSCMDRCGHCLMGIDSCVCFRARYAQQEDKLHQPFAVVHAVRQVLG